MPKQDNSSNVNLPSAARVVLVSLTIVVFLVGMVIYLDWRQTERKTLRCEAESFKLPSLAETGLSGSEPNVSARAAKARGSESEESLDPFSPAAHRASTWQETARTAH